MIEVYKKVFDLLTGRERKRYILLGGIMVLMSIAELFGMSSVLILLNVFSEPSNILENQTGGWIYKKLGFTEIFSFQVFLTLIVLSILISSQIFRAFGSYAIIRYSLMRGYSISSRLLAAVLMQPYTWFLQRNSSEISKNVLSDIMQLVFQVLIPSLQLISNLFLSVAIITFLLFVDATITAIAIAVVGGGYAAIYLGLRSFLGRIGQEALEMSSIRFRLIQEAIGGIKQLKLSALEKNFINRFDRASLKYARVQSDAQAFSQIPRFMMETVVIVLLLCAVLLMIFRNDGDIKEAIPTLGAFAFAAMRLLPTLQQSYLAFATLRNGNAVLNLVADEYKAISGGKSRPGSIQAGSQQLTLERELSLEGVSFSYEGTERSALHQINLTIKAHSTVGIVGGTGSGKTTLVDVILGLVPPSSGQILLDGVRLVPSNLHSLRRMIGYVPQNIFLTDNTIAQNIAFGLSADEVDMPAVIQAARTAAIHDFIVTELSDGYDTIVGERGVRLSGGQLQRIGIARALYYDPPLLILDEATSALDNVTERVVVEALNELGGKKTIIMVAHRLTTVRKCDQIALMNSGELVAKGTFQELLQKNDMFKKIALQEIT